MPESAPLLVSLSSFGADEVRRHGQAGFARLALAAGADGVEVRGELLQGEDGELAAIAAAVPRALRVFSSPAPLWTDTGEMDAQALDQGLRQARALQATRLKMSIGHAAAASPQALRAMAAQVEGSGVELVIENDQTPAAGTVPALQRFFAAADAAGWSPGMTFDMGNWHWQGECPQQAAQAFAARVRYVHCKGVERRARRWVAVPLAQSAAPWRSVLRSLPAQPWAIEYPLAGDDLEAVTRREIHLLRGLQAGTA